MIVSISMLVSIGKLLTIMLMLMFMLMTLSKLMTLSELMTLSKRIDPESSEEPAGEAKGTLLGDLPWNRFLAWHKKVLDTDSLISKSPLGKPN